MASHNINYLSKYKGDLKNKTVLLRVDFNVEDIKDSLRLERSLPTIKSLVKAGAKVVILSHRGRPTEEMSDKEKDKLSLRICAEYLCENLKRDVLLFTDFDFKSIKEQVSSPSKTKVFMLENLRFLKGEEENSIQLAKSLASLGDIYVNDAFAVCHRKDASISAITKFLPSYAGQSLEEEIAHLSSVISAKKKPLILILGGAKISTKIGLIKNLANKVDYFLIGGAMANTFMVAQGVDVRESFYEPEETKTAEKILKLEKTVLPVDFAAEKNKILDIGPETLRVFQEFINEAGMIVWNGPMGLFEREKFAKGSNELAKMIAKSKAISIIGGGETTDLIMSLGLEKKFTFLSTGGGAMLEFLSGKKLPGIEALSSKIKPKK